MKRSEINTAVRQASAFFSGNHWTLPPAPQWDVTDFGLGNFQSKGLVLINLASEVEYCEKLMYARKHQTTPEHYHKDKKEDIICRTGTLALVLWPEGMKDGEAMSLKVNGTWRAYVSGKELLLQAGERVTIFPGQWHMFYPLSEECIIGEVSTANDDLNDNFFLDADIGRYPELEEDEAPIVRLISEA